jgi:hypothetical protein
MQFTFTTTFLDAGFYPCVNLAFQPANAPLPQADMPRKNAVADIEINSAAAQASTGFHVRKAQNTFLAFLAIVIHSASFALKTIFSSAH